MFYFHFISFLFQHCLFKICLLQIIISFWLLTIFSKIPCFINLHCKICWAFNLSQSGFIFPIFSSFLLFLLPIFTSFHLIPTLLPIFTSFISLLLSLFQTLFTYLFIYFCLFTYICYFTTLCIHVWKNPLLYIHTLFLLLWL